MNTKRKVRKWLEQEEVDLFLAYKNVLGHSLPHAFVKDRIEEVEDLTEGPSRYPLEKFVLDIARNHPDAKIGMLSRDCANRSLNVLYVWNQLDPEQIKTLDINCCPSRLRDHGDCSYLEPEVAGSYKKENGITKDMRLDEADNLEDDDKFEKWMYEFQKCIKCYGCRDICPVCFCRECSLEHPDLIAPGSLPPEVPIFHLVRAVHMAGRCVDCGLCEDACPADIPLRLLYSKVNQIVGDTFDYSTGTDPAQPPFSIIGDKVTLEPKPMGS